MIGANEVSTGMPFWMIITIAGVSGLILLGWLTSTIVITKEATLQMIQRFGRHTRVAHPGLSLKAPWPIDSIAGQQSMQVLMLKIDVTLVTTDKAVLIVPVTVQYCVKSENEESVKLAFYRLSEVQKQIGAYLENEARAAGGKMSMGDIFQSTQEIREAIKKALDTKFEEYGFDIIDAQVTDPQPSSKVKESFDDVIASKQRAEAARNDAEAKKVKMIGEAEAEAESVKIKVQTFKGQREAIADTVEGIVKQLKKSGIDANRALSYLEGIDMRDTIRDASANPGTVILLPANYGGDEGKIIPLIKALEKKGEEATV